MKKNINKFFQILNFRQKINFSLLMILTIAATFLEVLGIGLIVPIITLAFGDENLNQGFYSSLINSVFFISDSKQLMNILLLFMFFLFFGKTIFFTFLIYFQSNFINNVMENSTTKLFKKYIMYPYEFFLETSSSKIINNINQEINQTVVSFMNNFFLLIIDIILFLGIFILLAYYQPLLLPIIFVISLLIMGSLKFILKNFLEKAGKLRHDTEEAKLKYLHQAFFGIKEIKISGKEENFFDKYKNHLTVIVRLRKIMQVLSNLPKYWLEFVFILFLVIYILAYNIYIGDLKDTLASLGLFSIASIKILPLLNRFTVSYQAIQYASKPLGIILDELNDKSYNSDFKPINNQKFNFKDFIEINNLSFQYKNTNKKILDQINLKINYLDFVGIFGDSGNGKTTLIDLIIGLLKPSSGKILVDGCNINTDFEKWRNSVGYVPQNIFILDDTIKKNVAFGLKEDAIDDLKVSKVLKLANLDSFVEDLKDGVNSNIGENASKISGGQKQRIGIARALYNDPSILVLDEATSSLDSENEQAILNTLTSLNKKITIIMITHNINSLKNCNRVIEIKNNTVSIKR